MQEGGGDFYSAFWAGTDRRNPASAEESSGRTLLCSPDWRTAWRGSPARRRGSPGSPDWRTARRGSPARRRGSPGTPDWRTARRGSPGTARRGFFRRRHLQILVRGRRVEMSEELAPMLSYSQGGEKLCAPHGGATHVGRYSRGTYGEHTFLVCRALLTGYLW